LFLDKNMEIKIGDFGLAAQLDHDGERKVLDWSHRLCFSMHYRKYPRTPKIIQKDAENPPTSSRLPLRNLTKNVMNCLTGVGALSPNPSEVFPKTRSSSARAPLVSLKNVLNPPPQDNHVNQSN
jgi:hypothetical protein